MREEKNTKSISGISKKALKPNIPRETKGKNSVSNTEVILDEAEDKKGIGKFIHDYQTLIVFALSIIATVLITFFDLTRYYYNVGKFTHWGISAKNIRIFENNRESFFLVLTLFITVGLIFVFFYNWEKEERKDNSNSCASYDKKMYFRIFLAPIFSCLCILPIILVWFIDTLGDALPSFILGEFIFFIFLFIACSVIVENNSNGGKNFFFFGVLILSSLIVFVIKGGYEKLEIWQKTLKIISNLTTFLFVSTLLISLISFFIFRDNEVKRIKFVKKYKKWGYKKKVVIFSFLFSVLIMIANSCAIFAFSSFLLWKKADTNGVKETFNLLIKVFIDSIIEDIFFMHGMLVLVIIVIFLFFGEGIRWMIQAFFRLFSVRIEELIPKIQKQEKWGSVFAVVVIIGLILGFFGLLGNVTAKDKTDFLVIQNLSRSVDSPAPNWIVLHEDKDSYIVAEYEERDNKEDSSNGEDKKAVDIYNEVQTVIKKEGVTVYKKTFSEVNLKKGTKPKEIDSDSASS